MAIASKIACLLSLSDDLKRFVAKKWLRSAAIDNKVHKVGMVQKYFTSHRLKCCATSYTSDLSIIWPFLTAWHLSTELLKELLKGLMFTECPQ